MEPQLVPTVDGQFYASPAPSQNSGAVNLLVFIIITFLIVILLLWIFSPTIVLNTNAYGALTRNINWGALIIWAIIITIVLALIFWAVSKRWHY